MRRIARACGGGSERRRTNEAAWTRGLFLRDKGKGNLRRFAVLAEPIRLRQALFEGGMNVNALVEETGGTQANISRHLQTLTQAHLLSR